MRDGTTAFWIILIVNTLITIVYWLFFRITRKYERSLLSRCLVMLLCPIIGPVYLALGWLLRKLFFHKPVDLTDVIFSKEREKSLLKADEESESGLVPIEDAVTVVDKHSAREVMLDVLRYDVRGSMKSIFVALNSEDSEISHYAASALQSELDRFHAEVQKTVSDIDDTEAALQDAEDYDGQWKTAAGTAYTQLLVARGCAPEPPAEDAPSAKDDSDLEEGRRKEEKKLVFADLSSKLEMSEDYARHEKSAHEQGLRAFYGERADQPSLEKRLVLQAEAAHDLLEDIHEVLRQKVLTNLESEKLSSLADRIACLLEKRDTLSAAEMAWVAEGFLQRKDYEKCREWSDHLLTVYPEALEAYSTQLKLNYDQGNSAGFHEALAQLKNSGIPLDHELMETVRVFM